MKTLYYESPSSPGFFVMVPGDEIEYESLALSCQDKVHNSVPDPDLEVRGNRASRLLDKGVERKFFGPSGLILVQK